jgi:hypothetical protein
MAKTEWHPDECFCCHARGMLDEITALDRWDLCGKCWAEIEALAKKHGYPEPASEAWELERIALQFMLSIASNPGIHNLTVNVDIDSITAVAFRFAESYLRLSKDPKAREAKLSSLLQVKAGFTFPSAKGL